VSDIHLQPNPNHPINQAFRQFLAQEAVQAEHLYILGDLFEMWVGDDVGLQTYATEIQAIRQLVDKGVPVSILYGNRDFLMRNAFWIATGATHLKQPRCIKVADKEVIVLHGDSLCTDDKDYQRMRLLLRNPVVTWLFLRLPAKKRIEIGEKMRANSQKYSLNKAENIMDVSDEAVKKLFLKYPHAEHMIHGHTHRPAHHTYQIGEKTKHRWVLGDWRPETHYLKVAENQAPELIAWPEPYETTSLED
jgi:UDP-2,3-diacylglucosamine hydrolase